MVDTSILLSALAFRSEKMAVLLEKVGEEYTESVAHIMISESVSKIMI